jgi:hypothetical protein
MEGGTGGKTRGAHTCRWMRYPTGRRLESFRRRATDGSRKAAASLVMGTTRSTPAATVHEGERTTRLRGVRFLVAALPETAGKAAGITRRRRNPSPDHRLQFGDTCSGVEGEMGRGRKRKGTGYFHFLVAWRVIMQLLRRWKIWG